jgi:CO dehydrogenase maturation factor
MEQLEGEPSDPVLVADMEAGLEHLSWAGGTLRHVDLLIVVLEPQAKVLITADRIIQLARQLGIARVATIGNRVLPGDEGDLEAFSRDRGCELLATIPEDRAVQDADRVGICPIDFAPDCGAVLAIDRLAGTIEALFEIP